jgi:DNA repair exonuclease SbcCD ATPase subunit
MTFDLEAARARLRSEIRDTDNSDGDRAAVYLDVVTAALDEITRLQKYCILTPDGKIFVPEGHPELERQAKRIAELEEDFKDVRANKDNAEAHIEDLRKLNDDLMANCNSLRSRAQRAEARVAKLEAALQVEKSAHEETKYADSEAANQAFALIAKQRAALARLGPRSGQRGQEISLLEENLTLASLTINRQNRTLIDQARQIDALKAELRTFLQKSIRLGHPDRSFESAIAAADEQLARRMPDLFGQEDKPATPAKIVLTKEQLAALEKVDAMLWKHASEHGIQKVGKILYDLRTGSGPAWAVTEERKIALKHVEMHLTGRPPKDLHWDWAAITIIRDMLQEARP